MYSALGSFYIPMFVMLFFYWRIYRAAIRTTQAINQGFKITGEYRQLLPKCSLIRVINNFFVELLEATLSLAETGLGSNYNLP